MFANVVVVFLLLQAVYAADWYHDNWCGKDLQYLLDRDCVKKFPSTYNRDWTCSVPDTKEIPADFFPDGDLSNVKVDTTSLSKYVTDSAVNVCLVVTKRVADDSAQGFSLFNRHFCAGDHSANDGYETWSR
jgi:hypothetical protein